MVEDKLNLTYYSGQDLYSDGDVEDELLDAVKNKDNIENELLTGNSWPHLYHLSDIRENILEWYDFDPKGSLLEIGSGCGALTGLFCRKVDHVVCIELSKRRSMINVTRNEEHDNLTVMLGNFEDIRLDEKFDYVTLIGVFEYSICYINSDNPFMDMLERAKSFLKPGGKLLIAIENKYGLKYFAGATEDHTGKLFDGIENYVNVDRVRTFSRKRLETMLKEAGFSNTSFYYPMPDYKMPDTIYSDERLPGVGSLRYASVSYDRDRYEFFDEGLAFDSICEDGLFKEFANSFLVIAGADDTKTSKTQYAKYNKLRKPQFQLATKFVENEGTICVEKQAIRECGSSHVKSLSEKRKLLSGLYKNAGLIDILSEDKDTVRFPFITGEGLSDRLHQSIGNKDKFIKAVSAALEINCSFSDESYVAFEMSEGFKEVFGDFADEDINTLKSMKSLKAANVDSTFDNFVKTDNGYVCLDYEWVFDFPIPEEFVKYRALFYYYSNNRAYLCRFFDSDEFLQMFGIDSQKKKIFEAMDDRFQQYVHGENRKYIYTANYKKQVAPMGKILNGDGCSVSDVAYRAERLRREPTLEEQKAMIAAINAEKRATIKRRVKLIVFHPVKALKKCIEKLS